MKLLKHLILSIIILFTCCKSNLSDDDLHKKVLSCFNKKDWESAIEMLDEVINRNPNDANAYYARAVANSNRKSRKVEVSQMINDLNHSISLDSSNHKALLLRFQTHFVASNLDEAILDINRLISLKGDSPFLLSWRGNCYFASKNFKLAEKDYEKRLSLGGPYEDMKSNYYYWVYSKYFGGNKESAMWDSAFLESRGFQKDSLLEKAILNDQLVWQNLVRFNLPQLTQKKIDEQL